MLYKYKVLILFMVCFFMVSITGISAKEIQFSNGGYAIIISPEENEEVSSDEVLILVSFIGLKGIIDLKSIRIVVDYIDVTQSATINDDYISYFPNNMNPGKHKVIISMRNVQGESMETIDFDFTSKESASGIGIKLEYRGDSFAEMRRETAPLFNLKTNQMEQTTKFYNRIGYNGYVGYSWFGIVGSFLITNQEKSFLMPNKPTDVQPINKYFLQISATPTPYLFRLGMGDFTPSISELTFRGKRVRGISAEIGLEVFHLSIVKGELERNINPILSTRGQTYTDSTITVIRPATYKRNVLAIAPSIGDETRFGFMFVKVKDDTNSISALDTLGNPISVVNAKGNNINIGTKTNISGTRPKDNIVFGVNFSSNLHKNRIRFRSEWAFSFLTNDISTGSLDSLAGNDISYLKNFESLLIFNTSTMPLPITSDTTVLNSKDASIRELLDFSKLSTSTATFTQLRLDYFNNQFVFEYEKVGSQYLSLANPFLATDNAGFSISDRLKLFKGKLYLRAKYESGSDNTANIKSATTNTNKWEVGFSAFPSANLPSGNFSFGMDNRDNGLQYKGIDNFNRIIVSNSSNQRISGVPQNNSTSSIRFSTSYDIGMGQTKNNIAFNMSLFNRDDKAIDESAFASHSNPDSLIGVLSRNSIGGIYSIILNTNYSFPLNTRISFTNSKSESKKYIKKNVDTYNTIGLSVGYDFLSDRSLEFDSMINLTLGNHHNKETYLSDPNLIPGKTIIGTDYKSTIMNINFETSFNLGHFSKSLKNHDIVAMYDFRRYSESDKTYHENPNIKIPSSNGDNSTVLVFRYQMSY